MVISVNNGAYIKAVKLKDKKYRDEYGLMLVEGEKLVKDALKYGYEAESIFLTEGKQTELYDSIKRYTVTDRMMKRLSAKTTPQGIVALIRKKPNEPKIPEGKSLILENIQDPGNLGTIIRTADAAGFAGVLMSPGCVDLYNPKTVRSSMGSFFNIPVKTDMGYDELYALKEKGFNLYCGALRDDSVAYTDVDFSMPSVIIIGNEANGVSNEILDMAEHIIIPIYGHAESLNAAVAGGIIMYEAIRQKTSRRR